MEIRAERAEFSGVACGVSEERYQLRAVRTKASRPRRTQTENACVRRARALSEGKSVRQSELNFRETRYHVGGGAPAISYLRKRQSKWGVEPKSLHDLSLGREEDEREKVDRYIFFFFPTKTMVWRMAAPERVA